MKVRKISSFLLSFFMPSFLFLSRIRELEKNLINAKERIFATCVAFGICA